MKLDWRLWLVLAIYFFVGALFVTRVPAWQTPDEPAHYNYTRQLAQSGRLPIIERGDYDQNLIANQIAPPDARPQNLDVVQYEDHQPPLFYLLSTPIFIAAGGSLIALRSLSLLIGAITIICAYGALREVFDAAPEIALFATAFVALLPQHIHMMAGYNNDALSEALIALTLWLCARWLMRAPSRGLLIALIAVVSLALWTKAQAYLTLPLAMATLWLRPYGAARVRAQMPLVGAVAVLGSALWARNITTYGGIDFLGLQRHNTVVIGQPTMSEWIARNGISGTLTQMAQTTFQSFWGQFGWMSIVLSSRLYLVFLVISLISLALFVNWFRARKLNPQQQKALSVFALLLLFNVLAFIWYNLQFVQFQGRYFYPALIPIATLFALGWHNACARVPVIRRWLWLIALGTFAALDVYLLLRVILPAMKA